MIYLIQTIDDDIVHDFSFELINAIRYQKEFNGRYDLDYRECSLDILKTLVQYKKEYIPIGTVEFVQSYFNKFHDYHLKPINIPNCLMDKEYSKRYIRNLNSFDSSAINDYDKNAEYFIKDHEIIKREQYPKIDKVSFMDDGHTYQISELVDIESEYRCFVHNNELLDIRRYSGSFELYPTINYINALIKQYSYHNPPKAYTVDVGINNEIGSFIIEIHEFFSCGLYGFSNYNKLPFMFSQWYYDKIKNINNDD